MIIERYLPIWGGAENQLHQLGAQLATHDVAPVVLTRRWTKDMPAKDVIDGIVVHRVGLPGPGGVATVVFSISVLWFLLKRAWGFDVVHTHGAIRLGALAVIGTALSKVRVVAKIATAGHVEQLQSNPFGRWFLRLFKRTDRVVSMTREIDAELGSFGYPASKIVRIGNGVDPKRFAPATDEGRQNWRRNRGLSEDAVVVVFSGRLVQRKGLDTLIEAWGKINAQGLNAHLFILGDGHGQSDSIEPQVRKLVIDQTIQHINFEGSVSYPEAYLAAADVFAFPSRREGYPNAILEAMASGLAIVASRIGGCTDLITEGQTGFLVKLDDAEAFFQTLSRVLSDRELRQFLGANARTQVENHHSMTSVAEVYAKIYRSVAPGDSGEM